MHGRLRRSLVVEEPEPVRAVRQGPVERREQCAARTAAHLERLFDRTDRAELRKALRDPEEALELAG